MQKMVETSLKCVHSLSWQAVLDLTAYRILFRTRDVSEVKAYCMRQWQKLHMGVVSPQDYIYAKEVKLGSYSCVHLLLDVGPKAYSRIARKAYRRPALF